MLSFRFQHDYDIVYKAENEEVNKTSVLFSIQQYLVRGHTSSCKLSIRVSVLVM